jgi:ATP-binding cassette subfamily B (MDR/TAP) protein 1
LYDQVRSNGCDPSGAVHSNETCDPSAVNIFGALFGIFFAAAVLPQISTIAESFTEARAACYLAILAMSRKVESDDDSSTNDGSTKIPLRRRSGAGNGSHTAPLPKYVIDSSSLEGRKPKSVKGNIEFKEVTFSYPTRQETNIFDKFSLNVETGKTVAIVGPSGSGKSTIAQLIERFYDPSGGSISFDGIDLRDLNVRWLRQQIGLVSQEPCLFACSIREVIASD